MCVFIAHKGIFFIIYLSLPEHRDLPSSHLHWISKGMMGKEEFQLHFAIPPRPDKRPAQQVFIPAGAHQGLLSLLARHRVFLPCWCVKGSSYPAGASHIFYFEILPWQPNKIATGHKTHKLGEESTNDPNCQIWFTSLRVLWKKCNLTIFPLFLWYGTFQLS